MREKQPARISAMEFTQDPVRFPETITLNGTLPDGAHVELVLAKRAFSTGSYGYGANGKVLIGGERFQVSANATLVGSKLRAQTDNAGPVEVQVGGA